MMIDEYSRASGVSRADLWQFAGTVALEIEIERANFGCDYDYNQGNQVRMKLSEVKCEKLFRLSIVQKIFFTKTRCGCWRGSRSATSSSSNLPCSSSGARIASQTRARRWQHMYICPI